MSRNNVFITFAFTVCVLIVAYSEYKCTKHQFIHLVNGDVQ